MKSSTLIVWLLVAACIAIDLAMMGELQIRRNEWPEAGGVIGLGLVFSQIALVALWAVWGRSNILVRGASTLLGVWAVSCLASYSETGGRAEVSQWFGVLLMYCGVALVPFIIARLANFQLSNQSADRSHPAKSHLSSNQFTIWGLLSLMTAVGITLAVARFAEFSIPRLAEAVVFFTLIAATACNGLWLYLYLTRVRYAIMATIVTCPIAGILLSLAELAGPEGTLHVPPMMCVQGVASLSAAAVLRSAGYRLVRGPGLSAAKASGSSSVSGPIPAGQRDEP